MATTAKAISGAPDLGSFSVSLSGLGRFFLNRFPGSRFAPALGLMESRWDSASVLAWPTSRPGESGDKSPHSRTHGLPLPRPRRAAHDAAGFGAGVLAIAQCLHAVD